MPTMKDHKGSINGHVGCPGKRLFFQRLGAPVVPFYPFSFWVPLVNPNSRKKGTLYYSGPLGNLEGNEVALCFKASGFVGI